MTKEDIQRPIKHIIEGWTFHAECQYVREQMLKYIADTEANLMKAAEERDKLATELDEQIHHAIEVGAAEMVEKDKLRAERDALASEVAKLQRRASSILEALDKQLCPWDVKEDSDCGVCISATELRAALVPAEGGEAE